MSNSSTNLATSISFHRGRRSPCFAWNTQYMYIRYIKMQINLYVARIRHHHTVHHLGRHLTMLTSETTLASLYSWTAYVRLYDRTNSNYTGIKTSPWHGTVRRYEWWLLACWVTVTNGMLTKLFSANKMKKSVFPYGVQSPWQSGSVVEVKVTYILVCKWLSAKTRGYELETGFKFECHLRFCPLLFRNPLRNTSQCTLYAAVN